MNKHILLLTAFFVLSLSACKDKKMVKTEVVVKEWLGKIIEFPDFKPVIPYTKDKDTLNSIKYAITGDKEYKVLFYADSSGCTSCKLQVHIWKSYIEELNLKVDFMFYFHPKAEKELLLLLKHALFSYPVFFDVKNELNKLNNFPIDPQYQCFLLDKNDRVLAIGNPIHNPKIWDLYKQIITGEVSTKQPVTTVETEQSETELKDLQIGKTSEATFTLKNTGTQPLII
jgi:hypothetical protein